MSSVRIERAKRARQGSGNLALSQSVNATIPQQSRRPSRDFQIVYALEEKYRYRYKSDYFCQDGKVRKPRYVCDRYGRHFITLQVISTGNHP